MKVIVGRLIVLVLLLGSVLLALRYGLGLGNTTILVLVVLVPLWPLMLRVFVDEARWRSQFSKWWFETWQVGIGVWFIAILPFRLGGGIVQTGHASLCTWLGNEHHGGEASVGCWEVAAVAWSLGYLFFFLMIKVHGVYNKFQSGGNPNAPRIIQWFTIGTLVLGLIDVTLFVAPQWRWLAVVTGLKDVGANRIMAELLVIVWFFVVDGWMWKSRFVLPRDKRQFKRFLWMVDFPGLLGFVVLATFLLVNVVPGGRAIETERFVAGAAAMNLLVVNTAFSVLLFWTARIKKV